MLTTSFQEGTNRIIVSDTEVDDNTPQNFTVCVNDSSDWKEIHDYIINENEIDNIPNRKIDCTSDMPNSELRSVYNMSVNEAEILKKHPKVAWVEQSTLFNPIVLEQRKYDEEFDKHRFTDRYKDATIRNLRPNNATTDSTTELDYTQWGLHRHQAKYNNFGTSQSLAADSQYSLTGKNVDVVIMDTGVRWDHPEFLKPGVSSFVDKDSTRVRDILIHGASEYNINWSSEGLVAPGTGSLSNYTVARVLGSSIPSSDYHGSHCAGTAAGNMFGAAFEANIWSIACVDRSDVGFSEPADGFDYIKVWHKNKPVNPLTGRKNPTVVNCSWGFRQFFNSNSTYNVSFRGSSYSKTQVDASATAVPAVYYLSYGFSTYRQFTSVKTASQSEANEVANDADCKNMTFVCAAGNSNGKQEELNGTDYDNEVTSGTFYYTSGYDNYYNRPGTPAITKLGQADAWIKVGSIDADRMSGTQERCSSFSDRGPAIDVWAAGSNILSPYAGSGSFADPRDNNFYLRQISGTSMATPNVVGVIATYLESNPSADQAKVREWLFEEGSTVASDSDYYDGYQSNSATDANYWGNDYSLKSSPRRILYNPYANNLRATVSGVELTGISFKQS
tara:strand:- start:2502 stop:4352 length:1851 start_codon:yes stop_codon:yes gene_type:complete